MVGSEDSILNRESTTSSSQSGKRKWKERSRKKYPKGAWVITEVHKVGEPMEPKVVRAKF